MAQQNISDRIGEFLKRAKDYWSACNASSMISSSCAAEAAGGITGYTEEATAKLCAEITEVAHKKGDARNDLTRIGPALAADLEARGDDSSALLMFLYAIDGGGGPEAAGPMWPELKVQLQRWAMAPSTIADSPTVRRDAAANQSSGRRSAAMSLRNFSKAIKMGPRQFKKRAKSEWDLQPDGDNGQRWTVQLDLVSPRIAEQIETYAETLAV